MTPASFKATKWSFQVFPWNKRKPQQSNPFITQTNFRYTTQQLGITTLVVKPYDLWFIGCHIHVKKNLYVITDYVGLRKLLLFLTLCWMRIRLYLFEYLNLHFSAEWFTSDITLEKYKENAELCFLNTDEMWLGQLFQA